MAPLTYASADSVSSVGRIAGINAAIEVPDLRRRIAASSSDAAKARALQLQERRIHRKQGLLRNGRLRPLRRAHVGAGEVKRAKHLRQDPGDR